MVGERGWVGEGTGPELTHSWGQGGGGGRRMVDGVVSGVQEWHWQHTQLRLVITETWNLVTYTYIITGINLPEQQISTRLQGKKAKRFNYTQDHSFFPWKKDEKCCPVLANEPLHYLRTSIFGMSKLWELTHLLQPSLCAGVWVLYEILKKQKL